MDPLPDLSERVSQCTVTLAMVTLSTDSEETNRLMAKAWEDLKHLEIQLRVLPELEESIARLGKIVNALEREAHRRRN